VAEAVAAGVELEAVYAEPGAPVPPGVEALEVAPGALAAVSDAVTPQGVAAVAPIPATGVADLPAGRPVLVCAGVADPGNAGTLLRSAEAAGFAGVVFTCGSVDPFGPKCVRSSAGSILRVRVVRTGEAAGVLDELAASGHRRVATRPRGGTPHTEADLGGGVALVLGNEAHGLPPGLDAHVDEWVSIAMAGPTESLNVAMAGTLLCFEVLRRG
jgi:TrmH family RNA methyltransferase